MTSATKKKYYTIGEVSQQLDVPASSLRFWEKAFSNLRPAKDDKGIRRYTTTDIAQIQMIVRLVKEQGYTLQGARDILKKRQYKHGNQPLSQEEVIIKLREIRQFLVTLREEFPPSL